MKHCEVFENIDSICQKFGITNYTLNSDGTFDVDGNVKLNRMDLDKLPLKFGRVTGFFDCSCNRLTSLNGGPKEVGGNFNCHFNKLNSLEGSPIGVGGNFYCYNNNITSLNGGPKEVGGIFYCRVNKLTSLEGAPEEVGGNFNCSYNQLITLEGGPREVGQDFICSHNQLITLEGSPKEVGGYFNCQNNKLTTLEGIPKVGNFECYGNPIHKVYELFPDHKSFVESLDYGYLKGTSIIKFRFQEALEEFDIEMPNEIKGYVWI